MTEVQKCILSIYKEVAKMCKENHIPYFAIGGTCIGAVRHHGFIPWDDDLDIAIPIEHYDRFIELSKRALPKHLALYTCDSVKHYIGLFAKIYDNRTSFIEKKQYKYPDAYKGVFIDIMPLGGLPANDKERNKVIKKLQRLSSINRVVRISPKASTKKKTLMKSFLLIFRLLPFNYFTRRYYKVLRNNPFCLSKFTGYTWSENLKKLVFPTAWFSDGIELPFEDTTIVCPVDYGKYLTSQFGDYMKLPPEEERKTAHDGIVDIEHSHSYYIGRLK